MIGTCRPSIDPMLMTRAGSSAVAADDSWGSSARVRKNGAFTLVAYNLSHAPSGYSASGAPHVAPALFTRMWSRSVVLGYPGREGDAVGFGRDIGGDADARPDLAQLGRDLVAYLGLAGRDVDLGPGLYEAPSDHEADAPAAAGDEGDLALDGEQTLRSSCRHGPEP